MNAPSASIGIVDDRRLPTWISIAAPSPHRSPRSVVRTTSPPLPEKGEGAQPALKASKRSQTLFLACSPSSLETKNNSNNILSQLCHQKKWNDVCIRCQSNPEDAMPVPLGPVFTNAEDKRFPPVKRERKNSDGEMRSSCLPCHARSLQAVHAATPLGIACQSQFDTCDKMLGVIEKLVTACPQQVQSNESVSGNTPLRDAIRNNSCTPDVLRVLVQADLTIPGFLCDKAVFRRDRDGLYPIDHLIMGVHAGTPTHSLASLKLFVHMCPQVIEESEMSSHIVVSPLVRLLSMGTSFGLHMQAYSDSHGYVEHYTKTAVAMNEASRTSKILEAAECLIPQHLTALRSRTTQCTALHVAIRNYGNIKALIEMLLDRDDNHEMIMERNVYGDLPLHVACSVGVPLDILKLVLQRTVAAAKTATSDSSKDLVWSVNKSGYTPIDLEWMRHIEGGRGFYEVRSFYPLEASGIRNQCMKQDKFYRALLQEAVDQVMKQGPLLDQYRNSRRKDQASVMVGALLDRIILLVKLSHGFRNIENVLRSGDDFLLHAASALTRVPGPSLPNPLLRLFAWMHPDKILQVDESGRLPLHYALMPPAGKQELQNQVPSWMQEVMGAERTSWIMFLLKQAPQSVMAADRDLRLPLHHALDNHNFRDNESSDSNRELGTKLQSQWTDVVKKLVRSFPESVDRRDPVTGLYPFMQAAQADDSNLETIFFLFRRNPSLVRRGSSSSKRHV